MTSETPSGFWAGSAENAFSSVVSSADPQYRQVARVGAFGREQAAHRTSSDAEKARDFGASIIVLPLIASSGASNEILAAIIHVDLARICRT
jgi:hypothetical protein